VLDAVHISDLHLGSDACRARSLERFLEGLPPTRRLVLGGDVLENTAVRLKKHHWRVLSLLRKLSDSLELVWVAGNHDWDAEAVAHLVGAEFVGHHVYESGGLRVMAVHGDEWDDFIRERPVLTWLADWAYWGLQKVSDRWARFAKYNSKEFLRCADKVRAGALRKGMDHDANVVVCGHTHHAEAQECLSFFRSYYNTGCWTEPVAHYLTASGGRLALHAVEAQD
jgi:UDP-2,3-diacylglucosamine pyrophosphatase LpxH